MLLNLYYRGILFYVFGNSVSLFILVLLILVLVLVKKCNSDYFSYFCK